MTAARVRTIGEGESRLILTIFYRSRWERLAYWLWKIDSLDLNEPHHSLHEVTDDSVRGRLAAWCSARDAAWQERYVRKNKNPPDRFLRHTHRITEEES